MLIPLQNALSSTVKVRPTIGRRETTNNSRIIQMTCKAMVQHQCTTVPVRKGTIVVGHCTVHCKVPRVLQKSAPTECLQGFNYMDNEVLMCIYYFMYTFRNIVKVFTVGRYDIHVCNHCIPHNMFCFFCFCAISMFML